MSPITHLLAGWVLAEASVKDSRARLHIALAGAAPDLDGLGVGMDAFNRFLNFPESDWFATYHHWLLHGLFGAVLAVLVSSLCGMRRWRVLLLVFASFHLHLLCDVLGSRGPNPVDIWPIHYLGPFSRNLTVTWADQWALNAWQNLVFTAALIAWMLYRGIRHGATVVSLVSDHVDAIVVQALRNRWRPRRD